MTSTMPAPSAARECAAPQSAHDPKKGPLANLLARHGYGPTAGAADARLTRAIEDVMAAGRIAIALKRDVELDQALSDLDEIRAAGSALLLGVDELVSIERAECDAEVARESWELTRTTDSARRAIRATQRAILSGLKFCRGVRTAHPELIR